MEIEKIGQIEVNGKSIDIDNLSKEDIKISLEKIRIEKANVLDNINEFLAELQN